jgi:hypothetical protein
LLRRWLLEGKGLGGLTASEEWSDCHPVTTASHRRGFCVESEEAEVRAEDDGDLE